MTKIMDISTERENNSVIIAIIGEVDALSAIQLDEKIKESFNLDVSYILIDCSNLNYISSAGLGVFMSYLKEIENSNKKMILYSLKEEVYSTFEILGLHHLLNILENKEAALSEC